MRFLLRSLATLSIGVSLNACATAPQPNSALQTETRPHGTDVHIHINPNSMDDMQLDAERALLAVESANFERAVILSNAFNRRNNPACWKSQGKCAYDAKWVRSMNQWAISEAKKYPRLIAFCGIEIGNDVASSDELAFCKKEGARGIKIHIDGTGLNLENRSTLTQLSAVASAAEELGLPILIHSGFRSLEDAKLLIQVARQNPKTTFIFAHLLGPNFRLLAENPLPNVYTDVSAAIFRKSFRENAEEVVETLRKFGIKRVLFGSDWPVYHPSETLSILSQYPLTEEELDLIVSGNANELFGPQPSVPAVWAVPSEVKTSK